MAIKPVFSVFPHGIKTNADKTKFYAIFKIVANYQTINGESIKTLNNSDWDSFIKSVNSYRFSPIYKENVLTIKVAIDHKGIEKLLPGSFITFKDPTAPIAEDEVPNPLKISKFNTKSFNIGLSNDLYNQKEEQYNFFNTLNENIGHAPTTQPPISKPSLEGDGKDKSNNAYDQLYRLQLESTAFANKKIKEIKQKASATGPLNFKQLYSLIIHEPYLAEQHFGLIREIAIPVTTFLTDQSVDPVNYKIVVDHVVLDQSNLTNMDGDFQIERANIGGKNKYYNGLAKKFITSGDFNNNVTASLSDPYKQSIELSASNTPHIDGIYINVYPNGGVDPFNIPCSRGFNAVVNNKENEIALHSLSYHQKKYRAYAFKKKAKITKEYIYKTSGYFNPRTVILTADDRGSRNNTIIAWRGDNLLVNADNTDTSNSNDKLNQTTITVENQAEKAFSQDKLFQTELKLVPGSQVQLAKGYTYTFFARTVGVTEHYLPIISELSGEDYLLTVEDEIQRKEAGNVVLTSIEFKNIPIKNLPLRPLIIKAPKPYPTGPGSKGETHNHIIINKAERDETSDYRVFFPPTIKLEDFKYLGYMSPSKIVGNFDPKNQDKYAARCEEIETNMQPNPISYATIEQSIKYLADPRLTSLHFYPADYYTYSMLKQKHTVSAPFIFNDKYPYYTNTKSKILAVSEKNAGAYEATINNYTIKLPNDGLYKFNIRQGVDTEESTVDEEFAISILAKPQKPVLPADGKVTRLEAFPNWWHLDLKIPDGNNWAGLKYKTNTWSLQYDERTVRSLLDSVPQNNNLVNNELSYQQLLQVLPIEDHLQSDLYPNNLSLSFNLAGIPGDRGTPIFSLQLSEKDKLTVLKNIGGNSPNVIIQLNDNSIYDTLINASTTPTIELHISFNKSENKFSLVYGNDDTSLINLDDMINPFLSARDLIVTPAILHHLATQQSQHITFKKTGEYILVNNLQHPYATKKSIKPFAISNYEGFFGDDTTGKFTITAGAAKEYQIPCNTKPTIPSIEANVVLYHITDEKPTANSRNITQQTTQMLQLTLSQDFMLEGSNSLGIVYKSNDDADHVSAVGDDITRISSFATINMEKILNTDDNTISPRIKKYFIAKKEIVINNKKYNIAQYQPYYNAQLKKWQVFIPLPSLFQWDTLFLRLICFKIAQGYNETTTYSDFAPAVILPIGRSSQISAVKQSNRVTITTKQIPGFDSQRIYYVKRATLQNHDLGYLNSERDNQSTNNFVNTDSGEEGHTLLFSGKKAIKIEPDSFNSPILVMEFEVFDNAAIKVEDKPQFVTYNPLFDQPGIRLINVAQFEF